MDPLPVVIPFIGLVLLQSILMGCAYCNVTRRLTKLEIVLYTSSPPLSANVVTRAPSNTAAGREDFVAISLHDGQATENGYVGGYRF